MNRLASDPKRCPNTGPRPTRPARPTNLNQEFLIQQLAQAGNRQHPRVGPTPQPSDQLNHLIATIHANQSHPSQKCQEKSKS